MKEFILWVRDSHFIYSPRSDKQFVIIANSMDDAIKRYHESGSHNREVLKVLSETVVTTS